MRIGSDRVMSKAVGTIFNSGRVRVLAGSSSTQALLGPNAAAAEMMISWITGMHEVTHVAWRGSRTVAANRAKAGLQDYIVSGWHWLLRPQGENMPV